MLHAAAIALFCEDIREEKSGQDTLVGIFSDNLLLPSTASPPFIIPKLAVYIRVNIDTSATYRTIRPRLSIPGEGDRPFSSLDDLIQQSQKDASTNGAPITGLLTKAIMSPFAVKMFGRIEAIVEIDGTDHIAGGLNLASAPST